MTAKKMRIPSSILITVVTVVTVIVLWFLLTPIYFTNGGGQAFPGPAGVLDAIRSIGFRNLGFHAGNTFWRVALGWSVGSFLGIQMGLWMSRNETVKAISTPIIEAIRPIPPIALIPFFIIWFGIGWSGQLVLIALGCFMVMTINTLVAVDNVPPIYIRAASAHGASRGRIFRTIIRPAILPNLISGFRIAAALAFSLGIAAEFMGAQSGLGYMIMVARRNLGTDTILLGIILIGLEAFVFDRTIKLINERRCRWNETSKESIKQTQSLLKGAKQ